MTMTTMILRMSRMTIMTTMRKMMAMMTMKTVITMMVIMMTMKTVILMMDDEDDEENGDDDDGDDDDHDDNGGNGNGLTKGRALGRAQRPLLRPHRAAPDSVSCWHKTNQTISVTNIVNNNIDNVIITLIL